MRKKRFIACLLVVLLLAVFSVTLVACKGKNSPFELPDNAASVEAPSAGTLLLAMLNGMGTSDDFVSMNFESDIKTNLAKPNETPVWDERKFYLKGNFLPATDGNPGAVELGLGVTCPRDPSQDVELFLQDGRFYLKAAGTSLYLEDIDFRWVIEQIRKIGSLQNLVDTIFGMIDGLELDSDINELIGIVAMLIFQVDNKLTTYVPGADDELNGTYTGSGHIALKFNPDELINTVVGALGGTSIDSILAGVGLTLKGPDNTPIYIDNFLKTLSFPNIDVYVEADVVNGKVQMPVNESGYYGLQLHVYDYQTEYFHMSTNSGFTKQKIDFIPENIVEYVPFGLAKFQFDTAFSVHVNDLDVGKVVNFFARTEFLPENSMTVSLNADIVIKLDADIRLKKEANPNNPSQLDDKSLLSLEIYKQNDLNTPLLGVYLKGEKLYINLDNFLKMNSDNIDLGITPGNIVISGVKFAEWITKGMDVAKDLVSGLLDDLFKKEGKAQTLSAVSATSDLEFREGFSEKDFVLAVSSDENGEPIISDTVAMILNVVRYTTALDEYFTYDQETGNINVLVNNLFFQKLCTNFNINVPELANMDDFGAINLGLNVDNNGLKDIYLTVDFNETLANINAELRISNFAYGFGHTEKLDQYIISRTTKDTPYIGNLTELIWSAMNDIDLEFTASLSLDAGTYNLGNFLGFDITQLVPSIPALSIEVKNGFILELNLKIQIQMDEVVVGTEIVKDEQGRDVEKEIKENIITRAYIGITNVKKNPLFPKDNMTIHFTYLDNRYEGNMDIGVSPATSSRAVASKTAGALFIDMSEFEMLKLGIPSFAIDINLTDALKEVIAGLNLGDLVIPELFADKNNQGSTQTFASTTDVSGGTALTDDNLMYALFDVATAEQTSRLLKITVTEAMVNRIFELIEPLLNKDSETQIKLPELPKFDLSLTIDKIEGIELIVGTMDGTKSIDLSLAINKFKIGVQNVINIDRFADDYVANSTKYGDPIDIKEIIDSGKGALNGLLQNVIYRALDDVDLGFKLKLSLPAGTYYLNDIFGNDLGSVFNIGGLPAIPIVVSEGGFVLDLDLSIKIQSAIVPKYDILGNKIPDEYEQIVSRAIIELKIAPNALISSGAESAVRLMYFDDRYEGNDGLGLQKYSAEQTGTDANKDPVYKIHKTHGTLLVNLSSIEIMKLTLPDLAFDIDLNDMLADIIGGIDVSGGTTPPTPNEGSGASVVQRVLSAVSGTADAQPTTAIRVAITTEIINSLLQQLGVSLPIILPEMEASFQISPEYGIEIGIEAKQYDPLVPEQEPTYKMIEGYLNIPKLLLGTSLADEQIAPPTGFNIANFGSAAAFDTKTLLQSIIYRAIDDVELELALAIEIAEGTYYADELFGIFGLDVGDNKLPIEVSQPFVLDLTLKIQMRWHKFVAGSERDEGITRAQISLYNKTPNIFFPTGSETEPVLTAYYFDDRGENNSSLGNQNFRKGVNGKKTNGTIFLDLQGFEFAKLQLPSMAIDIDLTEELEKAINGINLGEEKVASQEIIENYINQQAMTLGTVAAGDDSGNDNHYLQVLITMELLKELLDTFGVNVELPPLFDSVEGDFTISNINGIGLSVKMSDPFDETQRQVLSLNLGIKKISLGKETEIRVGALTQTYFARFGNKCIEKVDDIIYRALDDTSIEIDLKASVPAGKYNIAPILALIPNLEINDLFINFNDPFNLDLKLRVQLQLDTVKVVENGVEVDKTILSRAKIELVSYAPNFIFGGSAEGTTIIALYYFDDRLPANITKPDSDRLNLVQMGNIDPSTGLEKVTHGTLFANFSGLNIANIAIPPVKLDIDLTQVVLEAIANLTGGITLNGGIAEQANTFATKALSAVADGNGVTPDLGNYIKVSVTTGLINAILDYLKVDIGIELPNFTVDLGAYAETGITAILWIDAESENTTQRIDLALSFPSLALGQENTVDISTFHSDTFKTDFSNLIMKLLQYGNIRAKINVGANQSQFDIQRFLNNILSASNMSIALPIVLDMNDFANELTLDVKWEFDYETPNNSKLMVELKCDDQIALGLYLTEGKAYVDLSGLGLPKFVLANSRLVEKLVNLISKELDGLLGGLLTNNATGLQAMAADADGVSVAEMNTQLFAAALEDGGNTGTVNGDPTDVMTYVNLLLQHLSVTDGIISAEITAEMMRQVLNSLAVNIAEDISVAVSVDIFSGNLKLNATFDEISLGAELEVLNIGAEEHFEITAYLGDYAELNASRADVFVASIFDALDPGLWIDLVSKNAGITENYFKYTKITMQKVPKEGMSLPMTNGGWANGGSILLSLLRMDGYGSASGDPALYIILDIESGKLIIRGTSDLLPIDIASLHADTMVNIAIPLDLKSILISALGPIITEINTVGSANGNSVATTGDAELSAIFANLDFMGLLRGINIKLYGVRNIKINVELNPDFINTLLPRIINEGLTGMTIDLAGKGNSFVVSNLNYVTGRNDGFLDRFWDNLILEVVRIAVQDEGLGGLWGIVRPVVNGIKDNILDLVSRLLPFPYLVELNLNVYVINGKLDNLQLVGYGEDNKAQWQRERVELMLFNNSDAYGTGTQVLFGNMQAEHLNDIEFQAPYIHFDSSVDSAVNFANKFTTTAYKATRMKMYYETERDQNPSYLVDANAVSWEISYFNANGFDGENNVATLAKTAFSRNDMGAFMNGGSYISGYFRAIGTTTIDGQEYTTSVRVVIENNLDFIMKSTTKVDKIEVRAGRTLPDSITLRGLDNNNQEMTAYIRNVEGAMNKFVFSDEAYQKQIGDHTNYAKVTINFANGSSIEKDVEVHWHNANLALVDTSPIEISVMEYMNFFRNVYNAEKAFVQTSDGRKIYQDIQAVNINGTQLFETTQKTINYGGQNITIGVPIVSEGKPVLNNTGDIWTNANGFETQLDIYLANAHGDQSVLSRKIIVRPRVVDFVRFNSKNRIIIDTIQGRTDLPTSVRVFFKNGDESTFTIPYEAWDFSEVTERVNGVDQRTTFEFGVEKVYDNVKFRFNQDADEGYFDGDPANSASNIVSGITVAINAAVIDYVKADNDFSKRESTISYEDFADKNFDSLDLKLVTSTGKVVEYLDRITYTTGFVKEAVDASEAGNVLSGVDRVEYSNDAAGRAAYDQMIKDTTIKDGDSEEVQAKKRNEFARWSVVRETVNNYEIIDRGITVGEGGSIARVTVILYNMQPAEHDVRPTNNASKHKEVYLYFDVQKPIVKQD